MLDYRGRSLLATHHFDIPFDEDGLKILDHFDRDEEGNRDEVGQHEDPCAHSDEEDQEGKLDQDRVAGVVQLLLERKVVCTCLALTVEDEA